MVWKRATSWIWDWNRFVVSLLGLIVAPVHPTKCSFTDPTLKDSTLREVSIAQNVLVSLQAPTHLPMECRVPSIAQE